MEALSYAMLVQMIRAGVLDADDVEAMASQLDRDEEHDAAIRARAALIEGSADDNATWQRGKVVMIPRMHLVPPSDGGNSEL